MFSTWNIVGLKKFLHTFAAVIGSRNDRDEKGILLNSGAIPVAVTVSK